jgi:Na+-translocating ferredoxin:NAD+ oxidoreductase RnfA subunit
MNKVILGDCLEKLKDLEDNSVDSCILYGRYDIMGLCKHFGIKLKKQILVGFGLAQIMVLGMAKFVLKERNFILTDYLMSGLKVKYLKGIKLTTCVEFLLVAIQNIWKQSLQKLMSIVEIQQNHTLLKLIV